jgi:hypothetical protein
MARRLLFAACVVLCVSVSVDAVSLKRSQAVLDTWANKQGMNGEAFGGDEAEPTYVNAVRAAGGGHVSGAHANVTGSAESPGHVRRRRSRPHLNGGRDVHDALFSVHHDRPHPPGRLRRHHELNDLCVASWEAAAAHAFTLGRAPALTRLRRRVSSVRLDRRRRHGAAVHVVPGWRGVWRQVSGRNQATVGGARRQLLLGYLRVRFRALSRTPGLAGADAPVHAGTTGYPTPSACAPGRARCSSAAARRMAARTARARATCAATASTARCRRCTATRMKSPRFRTTWRATARPTKWTVRRRPRRRRRPCSPAWFRRGRCTSASARTSGRRLASRRRCRCWAVGSTAWSGATTSLEHGRSAPSATASTRRSRASTATALCALRARMAAPASS